MKFDIEAIVRESKNISYNFRSDILKKIDVEFSRYFNEDPSYFKLLTAISKLYPDAQFLELGTFTGSSAVAYLYGGTKKPVYTYDIADSHRFVHEGLQDRIILKKEDCIKADFSSLGKIDVIFLDISHNGDDEAAALRNMEAQGMLNDAMIIFDDILLNDNMKRLWAGVSGNEGQSKFDLTAHGHASGTGVLLV
jgi:predicted O-methyltransferase YrrM